MAGADRILRAPHSHPGKGAALSRDCPARRRARSPHQCRREHHSGLGSGRQRQWFPGGAPRRGGHEAGSGRRTDTRRSPPRTFRFSCGGCKVAEIASLGHRQPAGSFSRPFSFSLPRPVWLSLETAVRGWVALRSARRLVLSSDVQQLLDLGNDTPGFVLDLDGEHPLDLLLFLGIQSLLDFADLRFCQPETGRNRSASRLFEADARRLIPDNVILAQILNQHDHKERVRHGVERTSVVSANVSPVPPTKLHLHINLCPVGTEAPYSDSCAQKRWPEIYKHSYVALPSYFHATLLPTCTQ